MDKWKVEVLSLKQDNNKGFFIILELSALKFHLQCIQIFLSGCKLSMSDLLVIQDSFPLFQMACPGKDR